MASDRKRKRNVSTQDEAELPRPKVHILENGDQTLQSAKPEHNSGEHRQMKSERRKKSKRQVKPDALQKKHGNTQKTAVSGGTKSDGLATGEDFIPLQADESHEIRAKRRSPRSIRKEARQTKREGNVVDADSVTGGKSSSGAGARFICFVGNLPYTATSEQIATHFSKIQPKAIRLRTHKATGKSKGFAFLEFDDFDKMKTCLKLYHHSIFDPEQTESAMQGQPNANQDPRTGGRKINVELTAGGGGKSTNRKDKISKKNKKLEKERARDWKKKQEQEAEKSRNSRNGKRVQSSSVPGPDAMDNSAGADRGTIHPSRLNRVRG